MSDTFDVDDRWQRAKRDTYLTSLYEEGTVDGRYVFIEPSEGKSCSNILQEELDNDTILQNEERESLCISEKIVRFPCHECGREPEYKRCDTHTGQPYTAMCLEEVSNTKSGKAGWMEYSEADFLLYAFEARDGELDVFVVSMPPLQTWFWERIERFNSYTTDQYNATKSRLVDIKLLHQTGPSLHRYFVDENGYEEIDVLDEQGQFIDSDEAKSRYAASQSLWSELGNYPSPEETARTDTTDDFE